MPKFDKPFRDSFTLLCLALIFCTFAMLTLLDNEPELQQFKMSSGIAVSDGHSFRYRNYTQLQQGDIDYEVADVVVKLVAQLEQQLKKTHQRLLPLGIGLNVNIPAFAPGTGGKIKYQLTRLGRQAGIYYSDDLSQNPNVKAFGISMPSAPGFPWGLKEVPPNLDPPVDSDPRAETNAIKHNVVTISVMQGIPQAGANDERAVRHRLQGLVADKK